MQFLYSIVSLIIFLVVFLFRKDLRKVMIWTGMLSIPVFLLKFVLVPDFFRELSSGLYLEYVLEAIIFGFCFGGLAAVVFELLFHKKLKTVAHPHRHQLNWMIFGPIIFAVSALVLHWSFGVSIALGFLVQTIILLYFRKDLIWDSLLSGLFIALVYIIFYYLYFTVIPGKLTPLWFGDVTGISIFGLPLEEIFAIFAFGLLWGPLYEGTKGLTLKDVK